MATNNRNKATRNRPRNAQPASPLRRFLLSSTALQAVFLILGAPAYALPEGGTVADGQATIVKETPKKLTVNQTSDRVIIDWRSFNIAADEHTHFQQPSAGAWALNRIGGGDPTQILGRLTANGGVMIVNPNGVIFGHGSQIDVNKLVATTTDIKNRDFMAGKFDFTMSGSPNGMIVNNGNVTVAEKGLAAFVAPAVQNNGVIVARLAKVQLAAGNAFTLDMYGDRLVNVAVDGKVLNRVVGLDSKPVGSSVENTGEIIADGGYVALTADVAREAVDNAINTSGIVLARSAARQGGDIVLDGGDAGVVKVSGTLDASGRNEGEIGGRVVVTGEKVGLYDQARVDVSGDAGGGKAMIGGDYMGGVGDPAVIAQYGIQTETSPIRNAQFAYVADGASINADAIRKGDGGKAVVWSDQATRTYGSISARGGAEGGDGGFIETSGREYLEAGKAADASAPQGKGGTWLLDPRNVNITGSTSNGAFDGGTPDVFTPTGDDANVNASTIATALSAGTSVNITTGSTGTQAGNIAIMSSITKTGGGDATLSLNAAGGITQYVNTSLLSVASKLNVDLSAAAAIQIFGEIVTNGGNIAMTSTGSYIDITGNAPLSELAAGATGDITLRANGVGSTSTGIYLRTGTTLYGRDITLESSGVVWDEETSQSDFTTGILASRDVTLTGSSIGGTSTLWVYGGNGRTLTVNQTDPNTGTGYVKLRIDSGAQNRRFGIINVNLTDNGQPTQVNLHFPGSDTNEALSFSDDGNTLTINSNAVKLATYNRNFGLTTTGLNWDLYQNAVNLGTGTFSQNANGGTIRTGLGGASSSSSSSTTNTQASAETERLEARLANIVPPAPPPPATPSEQRLISTADYVKAMVETPKSSAIPAPRLQAFDDKGRALTTSNSFTFADAVQTITLSDGSKLALMPDGSVMGEGQYTAEQIREWNKNNPNIEFFIAKLETERAKAIESMKGWQAAKESVEQRQIAESKAAEERKVAEEKAAEQKLNTTTASAQKNTDAALLVLKKIKDDDGGIANRLAEYQKSYRETVWSVFGGELISAIGKMLQEKQISQQSYDFLQQKFDSLPRNAKFPTAADIAAGVDDATLLQTIMTAEATMKMAQDAKANPFEFIGNLLEENSAVISAAEKKYLVERSASIEADRAVQINASKASLNQAAQDKFISYYNSIDAEYATMIRTLEADLAAGRISTQTYSAVMPRIQADRNDAKNEKDKMNASVQAIISGISMDNGDISGVTFNALNRIDDLGSTTRQQWKYLSDSRSQIMQDYVSAALLEQQSKPQLIAETTLTTSPSQQIATQTQQATIQASREHQRDLTPVEKIQIKREWLAMSPAERLAYKRQHPEFAWLYNAQGVGVSTGQNLPIDANAQAVTLAAPSVSTPSNSSSTTSAANKVAAPPQSHVAEAKPVLAPQKDYGAGVRVVIENGRNVLYTPTGIFTNLEGLTPAQIESKAQTAVLQINMAKFAANAQESASTTAGQGQESSPRGASKTQSPPANSSLSSGAATSNPDQVIDIVKLAGVAIENSNRPVMAVLNEVVNQNSDITTTAGSVYGGQLEGLSSAARIAAEKISKAVSIGTPQEFTDMMLITPSDAILANGNVKTDQFLTAVNDISKFNRLGAAQKLENMAAVLDAAAKAANGETAGAISGAIQAVEKLQETDSRILTQNALIQQMLDSGQINGGNIKNFYNMEVYSPYEKAGLFGTGEPKKVRFLEIYSGLVGDLTRQ